jgi:carboxymethylenebutenolidase
MKSFCVVTRTFIAFLKNNPGQSLATHQVASHSSLTTGVKTMHRHYILSAVISVGTALILCDSAMAQQNSDWAKERLDKSPRHTEWVKVKHDNREVNCNVVYPEVKDKAPAVIVIHEIFGLTPWVRSAADQLAEAGYIAIAPDLLWGKAANGEGTDAILQSGGQPTQVIGTLPPDQITADLDAVADYVKKLPGCNGKVMVGGFCWGGGQSFRYATNNKDLKAAFVFYGTPPAEADLTRINCPVYGFYAQNDGARINGTLTSTADQMKKLGKTYEPVTYEGAGHGFMRAGEQPNPQEANKKAREDSWARWKELLKKM